LIDEWTYLEDNKINYTNIELDRPAFEAFNMNYYVDTFILYECDDLGDKVNAVLDIDEYQKSLPLVLLPATLMFFLTIPHLLLSCAYLCSKGKMVRKREKTRTFLVGAAFITHWIGLGLALIATIGSVLNKMIELDVSAATFGVI
jgi:hypothetical protein